ncbi:NlpC/P60 family protein [Formosa sediminum]|uniref:NlpC/P60 family protein n=1 Tax=Formosa sediminum TaxID=2594004 RepID=A0A516GQ29_9FLAO|nr:C40 family peptidase [Formosa sediminum]QDO93612.1 NlpC/P60 family protein [Formosa sediminum]
MHKLSLLLCLLICISSCKSTKKTTSYSKTNSISASNNTIETNSTSNDAVLAPIDREASKHLGTELRDYAKQFEGVRYKYGGTTTKGMDCSGLVYETFKAYNIDLPRVSRDMALEGSKINIEDVQVGDLLFFQTNPKRNTINHVGLVVASRTGNVEFIHSTTSKGVITSSLAERYWYYSFKEARRIL